MKLKPLSLVLALAAALPFALSAQESGKAEPTCEQVFKDIVVFKGVPAKDLIPAMEFMSASLKYECNDCHDEKDYSKSTRTKETAREMVVMQREINTKHFNGRLEVTCNSCHHGMEHPAGTPIPEGTEFRHQRMTNPPKPEEVFAKHLKAAGAEPALLVLTGKQTSPTGPNHKDVTTDTTFAYGAGGKFRATSSFGVFGSNGTTVWRDGFALSDEPAAIFNRMGRSWRGADCFAGLSRLTVAGTESLGKTATIVVRGQRQNGSTEELYFDPKTGLLVRMVNLTRSSIGTVVSVYDYSKFKAVGSCKVPMKQVLTFADGSKWTLDFATAKAEGTTDDALFEIGK